MSVESWQQGQSNQRNRVIIASGSAGDVNASFFAEPRGQAPASPGGEPPDASEKPLKEPAEEEATDPGKGE